MNNRQHYQFAPQRCTTLCLSADSHKVRLDHNLKPTAPRGLKLTQKIVLFFTHRFLSTEKLQLSSHSAFNDVTLCYLLFVVCECSQSVAVLSSKCSVELRWSG
uniref:Uncharacterized protein n=1 Tax=Gasterosteus aculeatus TaxID=69293 RepID=G3NHB9_GASAC